MKKSLMTLMLITVFGVPAAYAHGVQQQPSLLGALVQVGNHGSIANVAASVLSPSSLTNVHANVLDNNIKANVDIGQASRHSDTLLGISATVLDGGVGHRQDHW